MDTFGAPSLSHPFVTDDLGRDQLTRVLYGARISLKVGFLATLFGAVVGSFLGLLTGFVGGLPVHGFLGHLIGAGCPCGGGIHDRLSGGNERA